jgi:hypothetical protein
MNAVRGWTARAREKAPSELDKARAIVERNAQAQARLVEELLDMSRIAADRVPIDPRPMAPAAVLRDAVDAIAPSAATNRIDVRLQVADDVADILGDAARLRQVFSNLLTNAIKFTPPGGRVDVSVSNCGEHVEVVVADTGIGIAPEFLPFVFEPFRQEEAKFDASKGGLGLGLACVPQARRTAQRHHRCRQRGPGPRRHVSRASSPNIRGAAGRGDARTVRVSAFQNASFLMEGRTFRSARSGRTSRFGPPIASSATHSMRRGPRRCGDR